MESGNRPFNSTEVEFSSIIESFFCQQERMRRRGGGGIRRREEDDHRDDNDDDDQHHYYYCTMTRERDRHSVTSPDASDSSEMQLFMQMKPPPARNRITKGKCRVTKITLAQVLNENNDAKMRDQCSKDDDEEDDDAQEAATEQVKLTLLSKNDQDEDGYEESHLSK